MEQSSPTWGGARRGRYATRSPGVPWAGTEAENVQERVASGIQYGFNSRLMGTLKSTRRSFLKMEFVSAMGGGGKLLLPPGNRLLRVGNPERRGGTTIIKGGNTKIATRCTRPSSPTLDRCWVRSGRCEIKGVDAEPDGSNHHAATN